MMNQYQGIFLSLMSFFMLPLALTIFWIYGWHGIYLGCYSLAWMIILAKYFYKMFTNSKDSGLKYFLNISINGLAIIIQISIIVTLLQNKGFYPCDLGASCP